MTSAAHRFHVIRTLTSCDCPYPLDFSNCTHHFIERLDRLTRTGSGVGKVFAGFLVDKGHENGAEEHYITTTGIIVVRNHRTHKAITIMIARPAQLERYFRACGTVLPRIVGRIAEYNTSVCHYNY